MSKARDIVQRLIDQYLNEQPPGPPIEVDSDIHHHLMSQGHFYSRAPSGHVYDAGTYRYNYCPIAKDWTITGPSRTVPSGGGIFSQGGQTGWTQEIIGDDYEMKHHLGI